MHIQNIALTFVFFVHFFDFHKSRVVFLLICCLFSLFSRCISFYFFISVSFYSPFLLCNVPCIYAFFRFFTDFSRHFYYNIAVYFSILLRSCCCFVYVLAHAPCILLQVFVIFPKNRRVAFSFILEDLIYALLIF